jgi:hypothetical protein
MSFIRHNRYTQVRSDFKHEDIIDKVKFIIISNMIVQFLMIDSDLPKNLL